MITTLPVIWKLKTLSEFLIDKTIMTDHQYEFTSPPKPNRTFPPLNYLAENWKIGFMTIHHYRTPHSKNDDSHTSLNQ